LAEDVFEPKLCFVAFIDLLGFSSMVKSDLEAPSGNEMFMTKLYKVHEQTGALAKDKEIPVDIVQFSDSIVLATEFNKESFHDFLMIIAEYQLGLFSEGILARGGISYGKHFYKDGFMFSSGLIEAYSLESTIAKYPRIIVSSDLVELIYPGKVYNPEIPLIRESGELFFVDYLESANAEFVELQMNEIIIKLKNNESSIRDKYIWLIEYACHKFPALRLPFKRFE